jgi:tetratricopeptide (TPR) repeat protein
VKDLNSIEKTDPVTLARVYEDMTLLYTRVGDFGSAERTIEKAVELKQRTAASHSDMLLLQDTLVHLRFREGRLTEAAQLLDKITEQYGDDPRISTTLRAHVYRDSGEVAIFTKSADIAVARLRKALSISDGKYATPEYATVLMLLSQAYAADDNLQEAQAMAAEAYHRALGFQENFPEDAAMITGAYGAILNKQKQWTDARENLAHALALSKDRDTRMDIIHCLLEADHHLHEKQEESTLRRELKQLVAAAPREPMRENTMDIMAFTRSPSH